MVSAPTCHETTGSDEDPGNGAESAARRKVLQHQHEHQGDRQRIDHLGAGERFDIGQGVANDHVSRNHQDRRQDRCGDEDEFILGENQQQPEPGGDPDKTLGCQQRPGRHPAKGKRQQPQHAKQRTGDAKLTAALEQRRFRARYHPPLTFG